MRPSVEIIIARVLWLKNSRLYGTSYDMGCLSIDLEMSDSVGPHRWGIPVCLGPSYRN